MAQDLVLAVDRAFNRKKISIKSRDIVKPIAERLNPDTFTNHVEHESSKVILFGLAVDDSKSISDCGNTDNIINGYNLMIDAINMSKDINTSDIQMYCRYFNGKTLFPFTGMSGVKRMNHSNYSADGSTPLYDTVAELLSVMLLESEKHFYDGIQTRTVTVILTDGSDCRSSQFSNPESLRPLVEDFLKISSNLIIAYGVNDGETDFNNIFSRMGINSDCILTSDSSESEIRKMFLLISSSVRSGKSPRDIEKSLKLPKW